MPAGFCGSCATDCGRPPDRLGCRQRWQQRGSIRFGRAGRQPGRCLWRWRFCRAGHRCGRRGFRWRRRRRHVSAIDQRHNHDANAPCCARGARTGNLVIDGRRLWRCRRHPAVTSSAGVVSGVDACRRPALAGPRGCHVGTGRAGSGQCGCRYQQFGNAGKTRAVRLPACHDRRFCCDTARGATGRPCRNGPCLQGHKSGRCIQGDAACAVRASCRICAVARQRGRSVPVRAETGGQHAFDLTGVHDKRTIYFCSAPVLLRCR